MNRVLLKCDFQKQTLFIAIVLLVICSSVLWHNSAIDETFVYFRDYSLLVASLLSISFLFFNIKMKSIFELSVLDALLLMLTLYVIWRREVYTFDDENLTKTVLYLMLFIAVKSYKNIGKIALPFTMILIFFYWILTTFGLIEFITNKANFRKGISYNFSNAGVMGNYLALGYSIVLNQFFSSSKKGEKIKRNIYLFLLIQIVIALILTSARASWVSAFVSTFLVSFLYYNPKFDYKKIALGFSSAIAFVLVLIFSNFKMASVFGRLLIYKVSWYAILDNFFFGYGVGSFASVYNAYQAKYFSKIDTISATEWQVARVADSMRLACNEYLQAFIELGFVGILLILSTIILFIYLFYNNRSIKDETNIGFFASVISVLVCALFSYPFQETPICILFILMAAIVSRKTEIAFFALKTKPSIILYSTLILISTAGSLSLFKIFQSKKDWQRASIGASKGQFDDKKYNELYSVLNINGSFLYNYGSELSKAGQYEKSIKILDEAMKKVIDEKLLCFQAENYYQTKQWAKAEETYKFANNIVPSRFFPKQFLMDFYLKSGNNQRAIDIGRKIIDMPEKIPNNESQQIKLTAQYLIDSLRKSH